MSIREILDNDSLVIARDKWFEKLQQVFDGTYNANKAFALNGYCSVGKSNPYTEPEKWVDECLIDIAENKTNDILNDTMFKPLCVEYGIYGVHYVDKILGARVYMQDGQWYNDYLSTPIGSLQAPNLDNDETYQLSIRAAKQFVKSAGKLPLFGLPTIASPLNIAVNLYGQNILIEMLINPENARHDLQIITDLLVRLHSDFRKIIPSQQLQPVISWNRTQPPKYGQICGCTTQLISKELYHDFISNLDERILGVYENGGMIHLCGSHSQHIKTFANMKALKAIQLNDRAAEDLELYFNGLRDDQVIYLNPCEKMPIEKALEITKGKRLVIATDINYDYLI